MFERGDRFNLAKLRKVAPAPHKLDLEDIFADFGLAPSRMLNQWRTLRGELADPKTVETVEKFILAGEPIVLHSDQSGKLRGWHLGIPSDLGQYAYALATAAQEEVEPLLAGYKWPTFNEALLRNLHYNRGTRDRVTEVARLIKASPDEVPNWNYPVYQEPVVFNLSDGTRRVRPPSSFVAPDRPPQQTSLEKTRPRLPSS